jgi:hypothetical protein
MDFHQLFPELEVEAIKLSSSQFPCPQFIENSKNLNCLRLANKSKELDKDKRNYQFFYLYFF